MGTPKLFLFLSESHKKKVTLFTFCFVWGLTESSWEVVVDDLWDVSAEVCEHDAVGRQVLGSADLSVVVRHRWRPLVAFGADEVVVVVAMRHFA